LSYFEFKLNPDQPSARLTQNTITTSRKLLQYTIFFFTLTKILQKKKLVSKLVSVIVM